MIIIALWLVSYKKRFIRNNWKTNTLQSEFSWKNNQFWEAEITEFFEALFYEQKLTFANFNFFGWLELFTQIKLFLKNFLKTYWKLNSIKGN